jgi:hypothetical protein
VKDGERTRRDRYENDNPFVLPIPSFDRLLYFGCGYRYGEARISDADAKVNGNGIYIPRRGWYKPAELETYTSWLNAAARGRIPYVIIPLPKEEWIFACLEKQKWERLIAINDQPQSRQSRVEKQWEAIRAERVDLVDLRRRFIDALAQLGQRVPKIADDDTAVLKAIVEGEAALASQNTSEGEQIADTNVSNKRRSDGRRSTPHKPALEAESQVVQQQALELERLTTLFESLGQQVGPSS